jgi:hypothetical protein
VPWEGSGCSGHTSGFYSNLLGCRPQLLQSNFHDYPMVRIAEAPKVETIIM